MRAARPRPSRTGPWPLALVLACSLLAGACATVPRREPLAPEVVAAVATLERRWQSFVDLRTLANLQIRRAERTERLSGALLLRAPGSLRFEALSTFGPPILLVGAGADGVVVWEVLKNRAYLLPSSPDANRRWLGLALGAEDLVALLAGHVRPLKEPQTGAILPADDTGPSLVLTGGDTRQRIWMDLDTGQVRKVEWSGGKQPLLVGFTGGGPEEPITALSLSTPDGRLAVSARYQRPLLNSGFDADLIRVSVPQTVEMQDFR